MGKRRRAREIALSVLYEGEFQENSYEDVCQRFLEEENLDDDILRFLKDLVSCYLSHKKEVNDVIEQHSSNWKLSRMAYVDRNILRLGMTELKYFLEIPKSVTINEYLEIAKKYGTEDSSGFINGILDKIQKGSA